MKGTERVKQDIKFKNNPFYMWKASTTTDTRNMSVSLFGFNKPQPEFIDADAFSNGMTFPTKTSVSKMRSIYLSMKQTQILGTLLPDEIINTPDLKKNKSYAFVGILLFADVSGFTALCEKYNSIDNTGKGGPDKLTATLNHYIGIMVAAIYAHGGDVLKFSGDAFLALWKVKKHEYMYSIIHRALSCALFIQNTHGIYETEVKVFLQVKLAISAGNITFAMIGDDDSRNYVVVGPPVQEVKAAERVCVSGDVVLSLSAWGHLSPVNYEYQWKDDDHIRVIRIIYNPEESRREVMRSNAKRSASTTEVSASSTKHRESRKSWLLKKKVSSVLSFSEVRARIDESARKSLGSDLRMFLIPPVVQQIDADLPLEYLSEMRNVTIMFVNIIPVNLPTLDLINLVDRAYVIIWGLVYRAMGAVNKVSLFDKDVMFLIIFGLRGFNHEGKVAACLRCGYEIRQACCALEGVLCISVGVTTGQAYCGVVGHPLRREYTVIGAPVNKAARIMCAYPGKVTCDRNTFLFSNLASSYFTLQEYKSLKGIEAVGPIYEFTQEKRRNTLAAMHEGMYPILGRETEMMVFHKSLNDIEHPNRVEGALIIRGPSRVGKTRLLDEMILEAHKKGFLPIVIALHGVHSSLAYGAAQYIIKQILNIPDSASTAERERLLVDVLQGYVPPSDYCYLNEMMNVRFPSSNDLEPEVKLNHAKKIFKLVLMLGTRSLLFAIDDADYCDQLSWDLLMSVIEDKVKFMVMTMPKSSRPGASGALLIPPHLESCIINISLLGLNVDLLAPLACQFLNAKAVPPQLESLLISRSNGSPGWCESYLVSLYQSNCIKVEELTLRQVKQLNLIMPPLELLTRTSFAAVMPRFEIVQNDGATSPSEHDIHQIGRRTTYPQERRHFFSRFKRIKFRRAFSENPDTRFYSRGSRVNPVQVQQAYEDLRQTIEKARAQDKAEKLTGMMRSADDIPSEDFVRSYLTDYKVHPDSFVKTEQPELYSSDQGKGNQPKQTAVRLLDDNKSSSFEVGQNLLGARFEPNLGKKLNEVFSLFPNRWPLVPPNEKTLREQDSIVIKSLYEILSEKSELHQGSQSVRPVRLQENSPFESSVEITCYSSRQYLSSVRPSLVPKVTQDLIEESIKIFYENKMKFENQEKKNTLTVKPGKLSDVNLIKACPVDFGELQGPKDGTSTVEADDIPVLLHPVKKMPIKVQPVFDSDTELADIKIARSVTGGEEVLVRSQILNEGPVSCVQMMTDCGLEVNESNNARVNVKVEEEEQQVLKTLSEQYSKASLNPTCEPRKSFLRRMYNWATKRSVDNTVSKQESFKVELDEKDAELLPAIIINPTINLEEVTAPECFARVIMSAFDCLRPYEQLMLKCGSIIGNSFTRKMLIAIMHDPNPVLTAEAVKRLFEMQILRCGSEGSDVSTSGQKLLCTCPLTVEDIADDTLPRYSYCRVLVFRYALFRSTLYELLPLNQKKEFHVRAVEYLAQERALCAACDPSSAVFVRKASNKSTKNVEFDDSTSLVSKMPNFVQSTSGRYLIKSDRSDTVFGMTTSSPSEPTVSGVLTNIKTTKKPLCENFIPTRKLLDFRSCECLGVQAGVYKQLIGHCIAAGLREKQVEFMISYSFIIHKMGETDRAQRFLKEAKVELEESFQIDNRKKLRTFKKTFRLLLGKVHLLSGEICLEKRETRKAIENLMTALKLFGSRFVPLSSFRFVQQLHEHYVQYLHSKYPKLYLRKLTGRSKEDEAVCLSILSNVFMEKWDLAKLTALRSLNILQIRNDNVIELCHAYSNVLDISRHFGLFEYCQRIEICATSTFSEQFQVKSALELIAVGRLCWSMFSARLMSGHLESAAELGETTISISQKVAMNHAELHMVPQVEQVMMMVGRIRRAAVLLTGLQSHSVLYHVFSLDFILYTSFAVEKASLSIEALKSAIEDRDHIDPDLYRKALAILCVWALRCALHDRDQLCEAELWNQALLATSHVLCPEDNFNTMMTELTILEAHLLALGFTESSRLFGSLEMNRKIQIKIIEMEKIAKVAKAILPRFLHLRAYYIYKEFKDLPRALGLLSHAKNISISQGNVLEHEWISHSQKVWSKKAEDGETRFWTNCSKDDGYFDCSNCEKIVSWQSVMFTLP